MEGLISFLEQYWGYTLFGGFSIGSVITFTIAFVKVFKQNKGKNASFETVLNAVTDKYNMLTKQYEDIKVERDALAARDKYNAEVQATTFKAISYLAMASKLPLEEKIILQADFNKLATITKQVVVTEVKDIVNDTVNKLKDIPVEVVAEHKETVADIVKNTVAQTNSLLNKYTGDK